ncbi:potassium-transporting ATPase subunit A [Nitritalea halalkaliphila LW7]|uniref:Potassium-transporting ATPase potassium-binding subunit n=1 Tax=Nitritalea halalkaliphila LW7 TaxID=1189621 RepID=I5C079_9BACT|nr:potassium-transporting ATPase subunit KdpA [Nitritalea halalkaliphila]EIM75231.1 potassium-transporting ATPase subunit A [Nitritalea halalkaliphila LW7]
MITEILGVLLIFTLSCLLAWPLGKYMVRVFKGEKVWSDVFSPLERVLFRLSGIDPDEKWDWKKNMLALVTLNIGFFILAFIFLAFQGFHPFWNPNDFGNWEPTLAFNTAVSFTTNTNLQHYSGESGASYYTQLLVFCWLQFVSAGTGIAACALLFQALINKSSAVLGNFYTLLVKSCTRILLPLSVVVALLLVANGTPINFEAIQEVKTLEGEIQQVAAGPAAPMVAIKQMGTNGGGFFGPNSTHPFENPNYLTNIAENIAILLIPMALVFAFGFYTGRKKLALLFFAVMSLLFVAFTAISIHQEHAGNPFFESVGLAESRNMEGKEIRFGTAASSLWGVSTTATSNGSVNSMHDSHTPLSGGIFLLDMFINAIYGGVGVGFINFFIYVIVAVFIAGLMIGRTPEFMGKKIEAREIKIAALIILLHPFLILSGTALSSYLAAKDPSLSAEWIHNPGFHGLSEMLYEFTSSAANNGSGFEGLNDDTPFWNILNGIVMLLGRFLPIIGPLALAGSLALKKPVPESAGSLPLDTPAFGTVLLAVILIVAALAFFPVLALGPIAEYLSL